ncbi:right-handed parallel beta-helix repeat-containing protein [Chitinophaga arvensicola]|uniref:Right handed beta helix region n=1 Tax=Chitinophaga arvensicola TaxID=29529 RepID=A0A1I0SBX4_9BACT|nr:right-handed parallel beta-helix repeat-containing protein [Chitinophaga arvensicola]SEW54077.1 Right handed beta helix region [Chitinophaga arvensicola]
MYFFLFALVAGACSKGTTAINAEKVAQTHTYYVAPNGSNTADGSSNHPLASINTALGKANPGDTVMVRAGTYGEKVVFPRSGRLEKLITLKAYPGEKAVIDGTGMTVTGREALVTISNASYVVLEGFDICNLKSTAAGANVNGITADAGSGNIIIRKNKIYNIEHNVDPSQGRSGHGIEIIGNTADVMKNILVENNVIHDTKTGYSENLTINGYVDGFTIRGNTIYNTENIGIDAAGGYAANSNPAFNYARNGVISDNELYNIDMTHGPVGGTHGHGAIAIYVDGARNIIVERNRIHEADRGIGIVSENDAYPTSSCIVRNNFVSNCWRTGIYLGGYLGYTSGGTRNCYVVNNTLLFNNREPGAFGEIEGEIRLTEQCFDNVIRNNIVYARPVDIFVHKYTNTGSGNVIDNNLYYTTGMPQWIWGSTNGNVNMDFNAWKTASGMDAASVYGVDPLLISTTVPDLHIAPGSPARNSGVVISEAVNGTLDIDGKPRIVNNQISKGAQQ